MRKPTQTFRLFQLLKADKQVSVETIAKTLGINYYSVSVYIHEMKAQFKADIKSVRNGRKVVAYQLLNGAKIKVPEFRKGSLGEVPQPKTAKTRAASFAEEIESVNSGTVSEREFEDIRTSLGLDTMGLGRDW